MTKQEERDAFEADGFRTEAACQFGFETTNDDANEYKCNEAALIAFAKACERKGLAEASIIGIKLCGTATDARVLREMFRKIEKRITEFDAELTPIREAEETRCMIAAGYVRAPEGCGKLWIKSES